MTQDDAGSAPMLGSQQEYAFRLTLESKDHGARHFQETGEFDRQSELSTAVAHAIARSVAACLNDPPSSAEVMEAIEMNRGRSLMNGFATAVSRYWNAENELEKCLSVSVDLDKLMEGENPAKIEIAAKVLAASGVRVSRSG